MDYPTPRNRYERNKAKFHENHLDPPFLRPEYKNTPEMKKQNIQAAIQANVGMPKVLSPNNKSHEKAYKSFAQKIRAVTNDGWKLIDAVMEIFDRAMEQEKFDLALNCATWLADRGFGKPVQVTALTDSEGTPLAFTLWQPAGGAPAFPTGESEPSIPPPSLATPVIDFSSPPPIIEAKPDSYALGPARIWGIGEPEKEAGE